MRFITLICFVIILINLNLRGQTKIITGRVIDEDLETIPGAMIQNSDSILIGTADLDGYFKIEVPQETDTLLFTFVAMEWKTIKLHQNCDSVDVIMMYFAIYDFMAANRIDRLRMKRFKKLPELHYLAYEKGLFTTQQPCYEQYFVPLKERLRAIKQQRNN